MESLNLGILAHVDAGKTSLTERLLYNAGVIDHLGSVDKGDTQTDTLSVERQRGITVRSAVVSFEIDDVSVNLIDTPGHPDFIAEVERVLSVLDGAVLVVSAVEGVQAQTGILMRALRRLSIPTVIFINKIDRLGANGNRVLGEISERLTPDLVPMGSPSNEGTKDADCRPFGESDAQWLESAAEFLFHRVDDHSQRLLLDGEISYSTLRSVLEDQSRQSVVYPVYFGSAVTGAGVDDFTDDLTGLLPTARSDTAGPTRGTAFKIERDASNRRVAYVRMFSGEIALRQELSYGGTGESSKVTEIEVFEQGRTQSRASVSAGQIAKLRGLSDIAIGDMVGQDASRRTLQQFPPPTLETSVVPRRASDKLDLLRALDELAEQDPLISVRQDELGHIAVSLYGEVQKEVLHDTLVADYGVDVEFRSTRTINVERPAAIGEAREVLGKRGNPFLATIGLRVEPGPRGSGIRVDLAVKVESMPLYVFKSVEEFHDSLRGTVHDSLRQGLYGWEVVDCVVTLVECDYTAPGTKASDIRYLTPLVLFAALQQARTTVCEPISSVRLEVPSDSLTSTGAAVARLGGVTIDAELAGRLAVLSAEVPASNVHRLQQLLPGLSHGEGFLESSFSRYEPVRDAPPSRPRTDNNPLNRQEYLGRVTRRGLAAHKDGGAQ